MRSVSSASAESGNRATRSSSAVRAAEFALGSPSNTAAGKSSAWAIARSTVTDGLPAPLSICAKYRSEVREACAIWRRVMPRLARLRRTSRPRAARNAAPAPALLNASSGDLRSANLWLADLLCVLGFLAIGIAGKTSCTIVHMGIMHGSPAMGNKLLLQNLAPAAALFVCRLFVLLDRVWSGIVGGVHKRNDRLGFELGFDWRRFRAAARGGDASCDVFVSRRRRVDRWTGRRGRDGLGLNDRRGDRARERHPPLEGIDPAADR